MKLVHDNDITTDDYFIHFRVVQIDGVNYFQEELSDVLYSSTNLILENQAVYYNTSLGTMSLLSVVDNTVKAVYLNKKTKWPSWVTPNPPTNGVCPYYYGEGIRLLIKLYSPQSYNYGIVLSTAAHNNTNYRGFEIRQYGNDFQFCEFFNHYSTNNYTTPLVTIGYGVDNSFYIQLDFTEDNYRCKIIDKEQNVLIDTGVRANVPSGSYYQTPIMTSNWSNNSTKMRVHYHKYYLQSAINDFLQ